MPRMLRIANLRDGVIQSTLLVRLQYNVEVDSGTSGWVAQSLPVDWNVMPGVLDLHVTPRYDGRGDVDEGNCGEEENHKGQDVLHEYRK